MHSYFSNKTQPYSTADYPIFVAEVASTLNEILLFFDQYQKATDDNIKLYLLMEFLDGMKGTLFRQTQFAEFELEMHKIAEKGGQLTGDVLSSLYKKIVRKYYGHEMGVCFVPDYIKYEWAYVPHFYYNYYVYQYATSFTASISLSKDILEGNQESIKRYINFLSSGGSDYPINLLKKAGVDMTSDEPFNKTMEFMDWAMDELGKIINQ
ncbi:MAG: hypothetical protein H0Z29_11575 [Candidatus Marinimicrobia bacterium]|nr:hypothetical protein [Candidatus Neomarinimicrobiota bacterium]